MERITEPWQADSNAMAEPSLSHRQAADLTNGATLTDERTDLRTTTKTRNTRLVPNAPTPVDNPKLFHGGVPGLRVGDLIEPGHDRKVHEGYPWCEARVNGTTFAGMDPLSQPGRVYFTTHRLYAKHYASLWGRGDLYRVVPVGDVLRSPEDSIESFTAPALRVAAVLDRMVLLTMSERRRLFREWGIADAAVAS